MTPFQYKHAPDAAGAIALAALHDNAQFIAGGTSQVDLMKEGVQVPGTLIDISRIGLDTIEPTAAGGLRIGANVRNSVASDHAAIRRDYPAIAEALHAGASQQIRNMASMAGNLLQRTRCPYLRDPAQRCNKRSPGTGCAAVDGFNRVHAIFGQTDEGADNPRTCIAVHPSDLAVALAAHDAVIVIENGQGRREIGFDELHRLPGDDPRRDTSLAGDDLIVAIELPAFKGNSHYLKVRDRASYALRAGVLCCRDRDGRRPYRDGTHRARQRRAQAVAGPERRSDAGRPAAERRAVPPGSGRGAGGCEDLRHERLQAGARPCPRRAGLVGNGGSVTDAGAAGHRVRRERGRHRGREGGGMIRRSRCEPTRRTAVAALLNLEAGGDGAGHTP